MNREHIQEWRLRVEYIDNIVAKPAAVFGVLGNLLAEGYEYVNKFPLGSHVPWAGAALLAYGGYVFGKNHFLRHLSELEKDLSSSDPQVRI